MSFEYIYVILLVVSHVVTSWFFAVSPTLIMIISKLLFFTLWILLLVYTATASSENALDREQRVETIKSAYGELGRRVQVAITAQVGDLAQIEEQHRIASRFLITLDQVQSSQLSLKCGAQY